MVTGTYNLQWYPCPLKSEHKLIVLHRNKKSQLSNFVSHNFLINI